MIVDVLFEQYRRVFDLADEYYEFRRSVVRSTVLRMPARMWNPVTVFRMGIGAIKDWGRLDLLGDTVSDFQRRLIALSVSSEHSKHPWFDVLMRGSSPRHLAQLLLAKYPQVHFRSVLAVHEWRAGRLARISLSMKQVFAIVVTIGAFLVQSAPKAVVSRWPQVEDVQVWAYLIMVGAIAYLGLAFAPLWIKYKRESLRLTELGEAIKYAVILSEYKMSNTALQPTELASGEPGD